VRLTLLLLTALMMARPLAAQQDSLMRMAVQLATEGQGDSARALVSATLQRLSPRDPLYPEALFAAGAVADQSTVAMTYFRRVSLEYPNSEWADRSLLRLAQLAFASGDAAAAQRATHRILADYPLSDIRAEATFWAAQASFEVGNLTEGCGLLRQAGEIAGDNIELANRVRFHLQRCQALQIAGDSARADTIDPAGGPVIYTVQVAAVQTAAAADEMMERLHAAGFEPHVVRDPTDGLFKVRVGRFAGRQDAQRLVGDLRRRIGGQPFVVEER
jgi:tetratricopeptide (TPR) repeat protein